MSFIKHNLLLANGSISHHGEVPGSNEEMSAILENLVVLTWPRLVHSDLSSLIKQYYGTELKSLASLKYDRTATPFGRKLKVSSFCVSSQSEGQD